MTVTLVDGEVYFTSAPLGNISTTEITDTGYIAVRITVGNPGGRFETIVTNEPLVLPVPKPRLQSPSQYGSIGAPSLATINSTNVVYIIDLFKVSTTFNIQGILLNEQGGDSVLTKRDNLERLSKYGGVIRMVYRTGSNQKVVTGIINRLSVAEVSSGRETDEDSVASGSPISYAVQVQFVRGQNR